MELWEIVLIGGALAMDAVVVSLSDGMAEPKMARKKMLFLALLFAAFQAFMPLLGYGMGDTFFELIQKIAPRLSFFLLLLIGGKMIFDGVKEGMRSFRPVREPPHKIGIPQLLAQAAATSVDALAVGVTLLAAETKGALPAHIALCALIIGAVTFAFTLPAAALGKKAGEFSDRAEVLGGAVLVLIGARILLT